MALLTVGPSRTHSRNAADAEHMKAVTCARRMLRSLSLHASALGTRQTPSHAAACRAASIPLAPAAASWVPMRSLALQAAHTPARAVRGQRVTTRVAVAPGATAATPLSFRELGLSDELLSAVRAAHGCCFKHE